MEGGVGICGAVCRNEQVHILKIRCIDRNELDLHRPLPQFRHHGRCAACLRLCRAAHNRLCLCARAAARQRFPVALHLFLFVFQHGCLVIRRSFPLHKGDRPCGASGQAIAKPVTVIVAHELRFPTYHGDCAFMACCRACAAAVAFFFINLNDPANHIVFLLLLLDSVPASYYTVN